MVGPFQTEALESGEHGDNHVGLVGRAGPAVRVELEARGTGTGVQIAWAWQTQVLARAHVVTAAIGGACGGWGLQSRQRVSCFLLVVWPIRPLGLPALLP